MHFIHVHPIIHLAFQVHVASPTKTTFEGYVHMQTQTHREWLALRSPRLIMAPHTYPTTHVYHSNLQMNPHMWEI